MRVVHTIAAVLAACAVCVACVPRQPDAGRLPPPVDVPPIDVPPIDVPPPIEPVDPPVPDDESDEDLVGLTQAQLVERLGAPVRDPEEPPTATRDVVLFERVWVVIENGVVVRTHPREVVDVP